MLDIRFVEAQDLYKPGPSPQKVTALMTNRPEVRIAKSIKVKVRGKDRRGNAFVQTARTVNVSPKGACLDNLPCLQGPGEVIELGRWWKKARYRVVWVGQIGTPQAYQVGLYCLEPARNIWGVDFAAAPERGLPLHTMKAAPPSAPPEPRPLEIEAEESGPTADYEVRLRCPYGDEEAWVTLSGRRETLAQIQDMNWDLDCPTHGPQRELPLAARALASPPQASARREQSQRLVLRESARSGVRMARRVALLVHGSTPDGKSFLEEASTLLVNANGGLVDLAAQLQVGQTVQVVNRSTRRTEECRVAYVGTDAGGRNQVGIAFRHPVDYFWDVN